MPSQNSKKSVSIDKSIQIFKRVQLKNSSKMELVPFENLEAKIKELKRDNVKYFEIKNTNNSTKVTYLKSLFSAYYVVKVLGI